jgi:hypothetical protein
VRNRHEQVVLEQPEGAVSDVAETHTRLDHLVEDRLQPRGARDGAQGAADRALLLVRVLEPPDELGLGHDAGH